MEKQEGLFPPQTSLRQGSRHIFGRDNEQEAG